MNAGVKNGLEEEEAMVEGVVFLAVDFQRDGVVFGEKNLTPYNRDSESQMRVNPVFNY